LDHKTETQSQFPETVKRRSIALVAISLASFFSALTFSGVNVALPAINAEFEADAILLSWVVTSIILAVGVLQLPFGRLADIVGIKKVFVSGLIVSVCSSAMAVFATSIELLIVCQVIRGIGGAMIFSNGTAMLTAIYPPKDRGRVLGINAATLYAGLTTGPFLGGTLTEHLGWRSIFLANVPTYLLVIILILWKIRGEWCHSKGEKFDMAGSIIYGCGLVALMYGFSLLPEAAGIVLILLGIIGLTGFLKWESQARSPVLNISMIRNNWALIWPLVAAFISYSSTFAVVFLLSLYLQYIKGLNAEQAGLVLLAQPVMQSVLSPVSGRLSDRIEPRLIASAGMALTFIALLSFIFVDGNTSLVYISISLVVLGIGCGLFASPNTNATMSSVTPRFYGVVAATVGTMRSMGQIISMGITVIVMTLTMGRVIISPTYYPAFLTSTQITFGILTALSFAGILASFYGSRTRIHHPSSLLKM
jgi:EmrB/QacA subfamily drug resistance transporter